MACIQPLQEVSRDVMNLSSPEWVAVSPGIPKNFIRHPRNPTHFFVYPPPSNNLCFLVDYIEVPSIDSPCFLDIEAIIENYFSVIVDGVVFLAESIDNEYANSGRAKLFEERFINTLTVSIQSREITDTESSGIDPKRVG